MKRSQKVWDEKKGIWQPKISEEMVLREIVERLWYQAKIKMVRINQPWGGVVRQNETGIPDLIGHLKRTQVYQCKLEHMDKGKSVLTIETTIPVYIEVKRPGGARRPAQIRFIEEARSAGCAAFFAESWGDVVRELDAQCGVKLKGGP